MSRICSVDGCDRTRRGAHGWCLMHYKRWARLGSLDLPPKPTDEERFFSHVAMGRNGCWIWTGGKARGYGHFAAEGWQGGAHRWLYVKLRGPLPSDRHLDHLCRNPACVNPDHLEPVTCRENLLRGNTLQAKNAAKTHCVRGHEFTPENTYVYVRGDGRWPSRNCRRCRSDDLKRRAQHVHV